MREYIGCYFYSDHNRWNRKYLPLVQSSFHTTILADTQQTVLKQSFTNTTKKHIETCKYSFPFYDGVSVTDFTCEIAGRKLIGLVKEKAEAKAEYDAAVSKGKKAGLLEQSSTADVFFTSLGNVAPDQEVHVTITYIGELKNDLDNDGTRLTIPTHIAPRYGSLPAELRDSHQISTKGMDICVDVIMAKGQPIMALESPSHPISISLGKLSTDTVDTELSFSRASATLSDSSGGLEKDFVLLIKAKDSGSPTAVLQTHPSLANHRALVASLVPKFSLPSIRPEIVFVADRSGSMDENMAMLKQAIKVFLKSLPAGVKFNICSFGSSHTFLWPRSRTYTKATLAEADKHVGTFDADYGGTQTLAALESTIKNRWKDIPLEIILLTDGDIWGQETAFATINKAVASSKNQIRLFPLGIGNGVSHSLIEGLARAGNGFAQSVQLNERIDTRVIRMLKAALTPHISGYTLEVKYENDDDFELIDAVQDSLKLDVPENSLNEFKIAKPEISLFSTSADPDAMDTNNDNKAPIPGLVVPKLLQAPHTIPSLYSFSRTTVYLIMSPETVQRNPTSVILKADSEHGQLRLEIPITISDTPGETIHQLAARKAMQDLEEHRGWINSAIDTQGKRIVDLYPSRAEDIVKQEAVRLGTTYRVANKWCSFVAVEAECVDSAEKGHEQLSRPEELIFYDPTVSALGNQQLGGVQRKRKARNFSSRAPAFSSTQSRGSAVAAVAFSASSTSGPIVEDFMKEEGQEDVEEDRDEAENEGSSQDLGIDILERKQTLPESGYSSSHPAAVPPPPVPASMDRGSRGRGGGGAMLGGRGAGGGRGGGGALLSRSAGRGGGDLRFGGIGGGARSGAGGASAFFAKVLGSSKTESSYDEAKVSTKDLKSLSDSDKVHHLISLQNFDGFWALSNSLKTILGIKDAAWTAHSGDVWITVLTVTFLRMQLANEKEIWEMVVEKATDWLEQQKVDRRVFSDAESFLQGQN